MNTYEGPARLLTVAEFGERIGIKKSTIYEAMAKGAIRSVHIGRLRRIPESEVARLAVEGLPSRS
jgi:excisionase family DNA binding protein